MILKAILIFMSILFIVGCTFIITVMWGMKIPDDKMHIHKRNVCRYYAKQNRNRKQWGIWQ